jgi:hypothetical protein
MRIRLALLMILVAPQAGWSQGIVSGPARALPPIGLPLPLIGLPLPPIGLPAAGVGQPFFAGPRDYRLDAPRAGHFGTPIAGSVLPFFVVPMFVLMPGSLDAVAHPSQDAGYKHRRPRTRSKSASSSAVAAVPASGVARSGRLALVIQPATARVYLDGYYAGTAEDFARPAGELVLAPGIHHVEISASSYEPLTIDLKIEPDRTTTYRGELEPLAAGRVDRADASDAPQTFYFIPGCYAGNISPEEAKLPARCDLVKKHGFDQTHR